MLHRTAYLLLAALGGGCATVDEEALAAAPVIAFGEPGAVVDEEALARGDFVILFPAGATIPIETVLSGGIFAEGSGGTVYATLNAPVRYFRGFIQVGGSKWRPALSAFHGQVSLGATLSEDVHRVQMGLAADAAGD